MGSNRLIPNEEVDKSEVEFTSLSQVFEELCPIYMGYGMSYDDYWYDDAYKATYYRKAHEIQIKHADEEFWMQGMYIYDALCRVSPMLHAFSKSGTKPLPYLEQPFSYLNEAEKTKEQKEKEAENERLKAQIQFKMWSRAVAKKFKKKEE